MFNLHVRAAEQWEHIIVRTSAACVWLPPARVGRVGCCCALCSSRVDALLRRCVQFRARFDIESYTLFGACAQQTTALAILHRCIARRLRRLRVVVGIWKPIINVLTHTHRAQANTRATRIPLYRARVHMHRTCVCVVVVVFVVAYNCGTGTQNSLRWRRVRINRFKHVEHHRRAGDVHYVLVVRACVRTRVNAT